MAQRLIPGLPAGATGARAGAFLALVAGVALTHLWLTRALAERMSELSAAAAMPARIEVVYVRTLEPEAPRPLAPVAVAAAPAAPRAPRAARSGARPATAVEERPV
ncbi:MAG: hypothetical protein ABI699_05795, partial [Caldimonas sp.]